jgi:hypothetical protein
MDRRATLFVAFQNELMVGVLVAETPTVMGRKVCNAWVLETNDERIWPKYMEAFESWAREQGCKAMRHANARMGWIKNLKRYGYKPKRVVLEKEL